VVVFGLVLARSLTDSSMTAVRVLAGLSAAWLA
jgi:hypothetical protein